MSFVHSRFLSAPLCLMFVSDILDYVFNTTLVFYLTCTVWSHLRQDRRGSVTARSLSANMSMCLVDPCGADTVKFGGEGGSTSPEPKHLSLPRPAMILTLNPKNSSLKPTSLNPKKLEPKNPEKHNPKTQTPKHLTLKPKTPACVIGLVGVPRLKKNIHLQNRQPCAKKKAHRDRMMSGFFAVTT